MRTTSLSILASLVLAVSAHGMAEPPKEKAFTRLFNGRDLTGWYTFLQKHGKNADPDHLITIENGAIHLYKNAADGEHVVMGYIGTEKEYGDYHLRVQYRWGTKKFQPRYALKRDAGIYYHIQGADAVWPQALQFQVEQTNVGDLIALYGFGFDTWVDPKTRGDKMLTFLDPAHGGVAWVHGGKVDVYQKHLAGEWELDGWNTAEVIAKGDSVTHILNGHVVNRGTGVRLIDRAHPDVPARPITRGRIALELEAAEIEFRNVEIRELNVTARAGEIKAGAAAKALVADDSLVIGGGIGPGHAKGQEGELRTSAVVIGAVDGSKACLVACDVLMVERDVLDDAARQISAATGIPFDHILINCTHTHHAPTTVTVHGYHREEAFTRQVGAMCVAAAREAYARLKPVTLRFRLGEESSVGKNSRLLLKDGTIFWVGPHDDAVRPTGPFDPELPVLAFVGTEGKPEAVLFNHSTHTIGTVKPGVRSPSFYGLAAQELEKERGGTFLFFEGASGSTHNLDVATAEAVFRIKAALSDALEKAELRAVPSIKGKRAEITLKVRTFDDHAEDAVVTAYCTKRQPAPYHEQTIAIFRKMRQILSPRQGQERKTWVQAVVVGDIALVGVPGEFFTVLGQEIKRLSPYRYTYVFELANDYVGYIPDARGFDRGGYQVWTGLHSFLARGSGEAIVATAVDLLRALHDERCPMIGD